ncbi:MAG TPA: STAS domain-containing protein [Anaerolineae bacterium]|nr:STAS domain-containing protein [Anaerolineae bacterium]
MLPQAMVFAFIAGMPPVTGLYTAILGSIVAGLWGSSRQAQSGPTNTHSLLTLSVTSTVATMGTPEFLAAAGLLTLMVGVFRLLVGITRLGVLANFVSDAVIVGFTAGAGVLIAINQLPHLLGINVARGGGFVGTLQQVVLNIATTHLLSAALGVGAIIVIVILARINARIPGPLIAIVLSAAAVALFGLDGMGVKVIGELPRGLPPLATYIPITDLDLIGRLSTGALAVGAIGLVQTTSITRSISSLTRQRVDSNQEFVAQGLANMASAIFSGFLVTTSFNRSALNLQSGARTQMAAAFSGVFVLIGMLLLAPYAAFIPNAALAGVLMVIAYRMVDMPEIKRLLQGGRGDALIMATTLVATLLLPLEFAVLLGIVMSLGRYILRTSAPQVVPVVPDESYKHLAYQPDKPECPQLAVIEIRGDLYFGAVDHVEKQILAHMRQNPTQIYLLLRMQNVQVIDISGIHMLEFLLAAYREMGGDMYLVKVRGPVYERMKNLGFVTRLGEDHFLEEDQAISYLFYHVLDPAICIYECDVRVFAECQNLPRPTEHLPIPHTSPPDFSLPRISPQALYHALRGEQAPLVIDVREPREFRRSHIPQAVNMPLSHIFDYLDELPKDRVIVIVARTERRAWRAAAVLKQHGFERLQILAGGMLAWEGADLLTAVTPFAP